MASSLDATSAVSEIVGSLSLLLVSPGDAPRGSDPPHVGMTLAALAVSHLAWALPASPRAAAPRMQLREFGDNFYLGHNYETTASGQNNGPLAVVS